MQNTFLKKFFSAFFLIVFVCTKLLAQFEEGKSSSQVGSVSGIQTLPSTSGAVTYTPQAGVPRKIINIVRLKINELATTTGLPTAPLLYFKSGFTATVTVKIELWILASSGGGTPDQTISAQQFVVNYDPTSGNSYNPIDYVVLSGTTMYEQVKVTINTISITGLSNGWTASNVLPLLTVENEMQVLRYFTLSNNPSLLTPSINNTYDAVNHSDQLNVNWTFPIGANNNISQLEYAWVENETKAVYNTGGTFDPNKLLQNNSTRIDIDYNSNSFNIPLLFDADASKGGGTLYYRVRAALRKNDGSLIVGPWSAAQSFANNGHQPNMNWQSSTTFAENGKNKTVIQYFDGTLRARQTVAKDNSTGNTTVSETIYDLQGRPNVQILPTPTISTAIQYFSDFNRFTGQTTNDNPAKYFDLSVAGTQCNGAPQLDITYGNGKYYSPNNPWAAIDTSAKFIPDAGGYAYTETRYTDDPTQRVSSQGGVGKAHQINNGHDTKYFYGKPNQNELDALFGTEVGDVSHYFKNMVQDANGQVSVSYVDMHGRTIATALAGASPTNLSTINNNAAFYPVATGSLTNNLLTPANNIIRDNSIESISTLLVPSSTTYNFTYNLNPAILQQFNCNAQQICFDCKYNLEISIRSEDCSDAAPIVKHYNNLQIVPASQACGTSMGFTGDNGTTPSTQITFSSTLGIGSWIVRKTLTVNDSMFRVRRDSAMNVFLCRTQQNIIDSVFNSVSLSSSCNTPAATLNCTACQAKLVDYPTYKANFIAEVGGSATLTDAVIHAQFSQDSTDCANACGTTLRPELGTLAQLRTQMLNDMMPYSGQYARSTDSVGSPSRLEAKYNIFMTSYTGTYGAFGIKPFYKNPGSEPNGAATFYANIDGTADATIYPNGSADHTLLNTISTDNFVTLFKPNWAGQLIYYHPEYTKLNFAETTLKSSYSWLDSVLQCNTYAKALAKGYLTPLTNDPYFTYNSNAGYVPADRTKMGSDLTGNINGDVNYTIWRITNGMALCDQSQPVSTVKSCMMALLSTGMDPSATTTAQKDAVWQAFRNTYLGFRNEMVLGYINAQQAAVLSSAAMTELQVEGKQLRFANGQSLADQNGWTWWATATKTSDLGNVDSVALINSTNTYLAANNSDACVSQRLFWKARLMQCEQLQQFLNNQVPADTVKVNTIINLILDSMVMVCHNSIDNNNPAGASNVNPTKLPVVPNNFEDIIKNVFKQNHLDTFTNKYFCNPYSVDNPKPYNSNPPPFVNYKTFVDSCTCDRFSSLKTLANSAGYDYNSFTSMNAYFLATYKDTISQVVWQGLTQCLSGPHIFTYQNVPLTPVQIIPSFFNCNYALPCITCTILQSNTAAFRTLYPAFAGVPYTNGGSSTDTGKARQNDLWARYLNYKLGFSKTANEYAQAFLNCGLSSGSADLVVTDRYGQPPVDSAYSASSSITFMPGFITLTGDYFETDLTVTFIPGSGTALCAFDKPVTYIAMPDTTHSNPCQQVQKEADYIGIIIFQKRKDSLMANFDSLYKSKCLSARYTEVFYATYLPSEYHYTLYYYDQAGNLAKTLPPAAVRPNYNTTYLAQVQTARNAGTFLLNGTNIENMATQYRYNSMNQVVDQKTPDAGLSHFWYDKVGRLAVSQNAKQITIPAYSYTIYDALGRITEVGQKQQSAVMTQLISQDTTALKNWIANLTTGTAKQQMTVTVYDMAYAGFAGVAPVSQVNLRNRVSYTQVIDVDNTNVPPYRAATFYSYDIHGNVDTLVQDYGNAGVMNANGNRFKTLLYDYDLISGKVNQVRYQPGYADGFYHQYTYDAENRLTGVRTSRDSILWQNDAAYFYYRHGPLARMQLGDLQVQGVDYAYTIHGWLKSINPSYNNDAATSDLYDADGINSPPLFARDAYKLTLNYYDDINFTDYKPIVAPTGYVQGNALPTAQKYNLYNGNISSMAVNIRKLNAPLIFNYKYDQLNRIISMDAWAANGSFAPTGSAALPDYTERYTYDPNGNILSLSRNGNATTPSMDNLSYQYLYAKTAGGVGEYVPGQTPPTGVDHFTNQLASVRDAVASTNYTTDIDNQSALNYQYDATGNLISDVQAGITNITWSVYGKILSITVSGNVITYTYDASGNRISKLAGGITTWYVRDATGNVMAVYVQGDNTKNSGALTQAEVHVYGSSRLGIVNYNVNCTSLVMASLREFVRGIKIFELNNHLGNVLGTISDKKLQHTTDGTTVDYYNPDVLNAQDYYPGGMQMPGRRYAANNVYRYGFNGKENDNEVKGEGNQQDYGMRISDPRLCRFLSVDPLQKKFPALSPYQFSGDNPIATVDLDGLESAAINKGTQALVIILQGFGTNPPDNNTQASNAAKTNPNSGPDEALGSIISTGPKLQVVVYASSQTDNTKTDVLSTIKNFRSINPNGKVILIGHSGGADNIVELAKENKDVKINLMITLDVRDPKRLGWTDTNIPSNVENAINYYQNTDKLNLVSDRKMDFSSKTKGVNILSPGSDHRSIDNDQAQNVIQDINNELLNRNPVENATNRIQPVNDPKKSNSDPIPHIPLVSH